VISSDVHSSGLEPHPQRIHPSTHPTRSMLEERALLQSQLVCMQHAAERGDYNSKCA